MPAVRWWAGPWAPLLARLVQSCEPPSQSAYKLEVETMRHDSTDEEIKRLQLAELRANRPMQRLARAGIAGGVVFLLFFVLLWWFVSHL
jgi:hypothetical protein